jgi:phenylalanyl-tRNA synthetase beta chain
MRISYNQLKKYVDIDVSAEALSEVLTDIGLEVEGVEEISGAGGGMKGLKVGFVTEAEKHPDADKLKVTKVDIGTGELLQIVCGAPNVAAGQKVVVATIGSTLYPVGGEAFNIKKAKIRGVESFGMICAEDEIGMGKSHEGIIVLPENTQVGSDVKDYYKVEIDYVFEIGLTANRSDATGHIGVARDVTAALSIRNHKNYELKEPSAIKLPSVGEQPIKVEVESAALCPRYSGIMIKNISVKPSPQWLQTHLNNIGLRPINNVVDITNFILMEYGQPLHAFDADKLAGQKIVVKTLPDNTPFVTLDEVERKLSSADLMICDAEKPVCIAGVFGGLHSGVTEGTKNIFIESACFNSVSVRKTANRFNLRTDAAQRFEKGTDPNITVKVLTRAVGLLLEVAGGEVASDVVDVYPEIQKPYEVYLPYKKMDALIGIAIDRAVVKQILQKLEINIVSEDENGLRLNVPLFKADVQRDVDVIEEVLRIYGYNNIPFPEQFKVSLSHKAIPDKEGLKDKIAGLLSGNGFLEILTNSITHSKYAEAAYGNADLDLMRATMLFSGLESVAYNHNRRNFDLKFYEFGSTYHQIDNKLSETEHLALFVTGNEADEHWKQKPSKADVFYLKGIVKNILNALGISQYEMEETANNEIETGLKISAGKKELVTFGMVSKKLLKQFDIEMPVLYADFLWANVLKQQAKQQVKFVEIPKFPWVRRDLALLLDRQVTFSDVEKIAYREIKKVLKSVNLFDIYEDKRLGDNKKSYAISFIFADEQKTLKDEEVDKWMQRLMEQYKTELKAEIR